MRTETKHYKLKLKDQLTDGSFIWLQCALASCGAVYCNRSCLWVCDSGRAGGVQTLLQPARAQCLRLSERFFITNDVRIVKTACFVMLRDKTDKNRPIMQFYVSVGK